MLRIILMGALIVICCGSIYGAPGSQPTNLKEEKSLQAIEEAVETLSKESPVLYPYARRLLDIRKEIDRIVNDYREETISKDAAMKKMEPLVKEELQIRNNPDYQIKLRVLRILSESIFPQP